MKFDPVNASMKSLRCKHDTRPTIHSYFLLEGK